MRYLTVFLFFTFSLIASAQINVGLGARILSTPNDGFEANILGVKASAKIFNRVTYVSGHYSLNSSLSKFDPKIQTLGVEFGAWSGNLEKLSGQIGLGANYLFAGQKQGEGDRIVIVAKASARLSFGTTNLEISGGVGYQSTRFNTFGLTPPYRRVTWFASLANTVEASIYKTF